MSEWTVDTLHEHILSLLVERDRAVQAALAAAEKAVQAALLAADRAVAKAENAAERRFESVNEFRSTLSDQASQFVTRQEHQVALDALSEKVDDLRNRERTQSGHASGVTDGWKLLVGAVALVATLITIFLTVRGAP